MKTMLYRWAMAEEIGYTPITTFWQDFSIADTFGDEAIEDTFKRAFEEWKYNYKYLTELVMVLNHKMWQYDSLGNNDRVKLYHKLWSTADGYAVNNLKGDELNYFFTVTD